MKISKEIKIALVAVLSAIIVYVGIIFLKGLKLFNDEVSYFVEIADIQGMPTASDARQWTESGHRESHHIQSQSPRPHGRNHY